MNLIDRIKKHEGFRAKPYRCPAGRLTIGYGTNLEDRGISKEEAQYLLENDVRDCWNKCARFTFWKELSIERQEVIIEICYQLGFCGLLSFKKMLKALESRDFEKASKEMLDSAWAKQTNKRAVELSTIMKG